MKLKGKVTTLSKGRKIRSQIRPQRLFCRKYRIAGQEYGSKENGQSKSREYKIQTAVQTKEQGSEPGIRDDCPTHVRKQ